jgi:hypothetical protein
VDTIGLVGFAQSNNPINPIKNLTPKTTQTISNQTQIMKQKIKEKNPSTAPTQISINITSHNKHQEKKIHNKPTQTARS